MTAAVTRANRRRDEREQFADAFAGAFLMPGPALAARFPAVQRARPNGGATPNDALGLCRLYGVSFEAMMRRLEGLRLLPAGAYDALRGKGFKPDEARTLAGLPIERPTGPRLPARYERLAA